MIGLLNFLLLVLISPICVFYRNHFARDYCKENPNVTQAEFAKIWLELDKETKEVYHMQALLSLWH